MKLLWKSLSISISKLLSLNYGPSFKKKLLIVLVPNLFNISCGSTTFPNDLDIFTLLLSQCPWQITYLGNCISAANKKAGQ
jgi:hypothetical protein